MDKGLRHPILLDDACAARIEGRFYVRAGRSSSSNPPGMSASADAGPVRAMLAERRRLLIY
jgi:hypothetical protein